MISAYCIPPTAYCLLPTAYCLLPTAYCDAPVAVAMSGGVDSSLAALLLRDEGREVFGVHLRVFDSERSARHADDARRVAEWMGIELRVLDVRDVFRREVVDPFIEEYLRGRTPNPCVGCNRTIKLGALLNRAREWGAGALATGHYARVAFDGARWTLRRGLAKGKDQSYYLSMLRQEQLARFLTPLGQLDKTRVREIALQRGLPVAQKEESQDVCFIPDGDYKAFIETHAGGRLAGDGDIVDLKGKVVGRHRGAWRFTIGQRRGIGVSGRYPLYVVAIDMAANRVVVGSKKAAQSSQLTAEQVNTVSIPPIEAPMRCQVQIRYRRAPAAASVEPLAPDGSTLRVHFEEPQTAIAPGQTAVFYEGDMVLAGGWIGG